MNRIKITGWAHLMMETLTLLALPLTPTILALVT